MAYIMENVTLLKKSILNGTSFLVDQNKISFLNSSLKNYKHMKMNVESFIMTAPYVMFKTEIPLNEEFNLQKEFYCDQLIAKGCTTFLTFAVVNYEYEFQEKMNRMEKSFLNSPVDYAIGVKIPIRLLTVPFMRQCMKRKIPAIFIEVDHADELYNIPWGWIKEAMFPHNCPLIPIFIERDDENEMKRSNMIWKNIISKGKIPSFLDELLENEPISLKNLAKMGIFPQKGSIHHGSEVSYNLYQKGREINGMNETTLYHEHENELLITVHKGTVIRAGGHVKFQPGYGEYLKIIKPSYFLIE